MKCDKCGKMESYIPEVHDRYGDNNVCLMCSDCRGVYEYEEDCPHCGAIIMVN